MNLNITLNALVDRFAIVEEGQRQNLIETITRLFPRGSVIDVEFTISSTGEPVRGVCGWITPVEKEYKYPCDTLLLSDGTCPHLERHTEEQLRYEESKLQPRLELAVGESSGQQ